MKHTITLSDTHRDFLADTFARNRALFAGWSMEGEDETGDENPEGQEPGEGEETPSSDEGNPDPEGQEPEGEEESGETDDSTLTLEDAKAALTTIRRKEAATRTRLRELEKQLDGATTPEQIEEIKAEVKREAAAEARTLLVENVALKHKLPEELADALKGDTREELEKHAAVLAKFVPVEDEGEDPEVSGGLDPNDDPEGAFDPAKLAASLRSRR